MGKRVQEKGEDDPQDFHHNLWATVFKLKNFLGSITFIIVLQKSSDNSEETTNQFDTVKNAAFLTSKNKETICMV